MRVELHPDARAELRGAALWYDERRDGLGDEFVAEVLAAAVFAGPGDRTRPASATLLALAIGHSVWLIDASTTSRMVFWTST